MAKRGRIRRAGRVAEELAKLKLGRYPFLAGIPHYERVRGMTLSQSTLVEDRRKLRQFAKIFETMKSKGEINTTDPRHMDYPEIEAFYLWMRKGGQSSTTRRTYLKILNRYLRTWGNFIIDIMVDEGSASMPAEEESPIKALEIDEIRAVFAAADEEEGYRGIVIRGLLAVCFGTGIRPKEIFNPEVLDIDLKNRRFFVRHPKGEETWGKKQWMSIIREDMLPRIQRFLDERAAYLASVNVKSKDLFVNPATGAPLASGSLRRYKDRVARAAGIPFAIKDLRSTLTTVLIDDDYARLKPMSKQLRHSSEKITEKYYARINVTKAIQKDLGTAWKSSEIV